MTAGLKRYYLEGSIHFITFSCYRRLPHLGTAARRDLFLRVLEQARRRYGFALLGYVVMPEHVHLLMTMPMVGDPSVVMKVVKDGLVEVNLFPWTFSVRESHSFQTKA